tara:strand:+ start:279 stop:1124 length:846 start_codon:yes stop_codon:yes gene_type:complete
MTKDNKIIEMNVVIQEVKSFQNDLTEIRNTAYGWHSNEYKTANESLYSIFSKLYVLYDNLTTVTGNATTQKREWIEKECEAKGVILSKKPTIIQLLINYAFFVEGVDNSKRLSSYVRVFNTATSTNNVRSDNIADWIIKNGGIEQIRQQSTSSAVTKEQRIEEGTKLLNRFETIGNVSNNKTKQYASSKKDEVVLLVGVLKADGSVAVKHTIFEEEDNSNIKGSTVIKTALCNVYSKHKEAEAKEAKLQNAEKEANDKAEAKNNIILNANVEKVEVERKVA